MAVPNFLGEGDLLRLLPPPGGAGRDADLALGPAPAGAQRARKPKKPRPPTGGTDAGGGGGDGAGGLEAHAAELARGVSEAITGPVDAALMREAAEGREPAPLDHAMAARLEGVWSALEMPMLDKLGMVVKYSELGNVAKLEESLDAWTHAADSIAQREALLAALASAKLRHRQQSLGEKDVAQQEELTQLADEITRLEEQHTSVARDCSLFCNSLLDRYGDVATLRGMPYAEDLQCPLEQSLARVTAINNVTR